MAGLLETDLELYRLINQEKERQQHTLTLIASENYASKAVLEATGSVLTNKYAEGYPGKRYYGGCEIVDTVEILAQNRCKELFGAEHVNVQPHAGSQANMAVYFSMLKPGDTIMGMSLAEGGHLTHGHSVNFSGSIFSSVQYTVNKQTELLDFKEIEELAHRHKPKLIIAGASAYSRSIDFNKFSEIAQTVGALLLVDMAHIAGLVAAGLHQNPVPFADFVSSTTHKTLRGPRGGLVMSKNIYAQKLDKAIMPGLQGGPLMHVIAAKAVSFKEALNDTFKEYQTQVVKNAQSMAEAFKNLGYRIVADGTDNHLFVVDLRSKKLNGRIAEKTLEKVNIAISRSCVPFDTESPFITSGIRIGTPAISTRGFQEKDVIHTVHLIDEALQNHANEQQLQKIKKEVLRLCAQFPVYTDLAL